MRLCSLCFLFLFIFSPLSATKVFADDTPTPLPTLTPTNEPLYRTQTPVPTGIYVCPPNNNNVHGWGFVTPNAYWMDKCWQCITRTSVFPTSTMNPLTTWTPSPSPTGTATNTPVPTSTTTPFTTSNILNTLGTLTPSYTNVSMSDFNNYPATKNYSSYNNTNTWLRSSNGSSLATASYRTGWIIENNSKMGSYAYGAQVYISIYNASTGYIRLEFAPDSYKNANQIINLAPSATQVVYWTNISGWGAFDNAATAPVKFDVIVLNSRGSGSDYVITAEQGDVGNSGSRKMEFIYQKIFGGYSVQQYTPTPTLTPTINSYCYNVEGVGQGADPDLIFKMPSFTVGWGRCMNFSGLTIDLTWLDSLFPNLRANNGWSDTIGTTPFRLCYRPLSLGTLTIFGLNIDMDMIALVLGGILIIRFIARGGG